MSLWQDVRFGLRMLVKDRWFTLAALSALALGIGVNAMVFTLVNAVLVRNLPFRDPTRIMAVNMRDGRDLTNEIRTAHVVLWALRNDRI